MTRAEADAVLAVWAELLADPSDRCKYGNAVLELFRAAVHFQGEAWRLEAVSRLDVAHMAALAKRNRDLAEMVKQERGGEHVEADQVATIVRPNWWLS